MGGVEGVAFAFQDRRAEGGVLIVDIVGDVREEGGSEINMVTGDRVNWRMDLCWSGRRLGGINKFLACGR